MISNLLIKMERFRRMAMLLMTLCAFAAAYAQGPTSAEINAAIVRQSDVAITWTNDAQYPWTLVNDPDDGVCLQTNEVDEETWRSSVSFSFTLSSPSGLAFQYRNDGQSPEDNITIMVDDAEVINYNGSEWKTFYTALTEGSHTVTIERYDVNGMDNESYFARIRNVVMAEVQWDEVKLDAPGEFIEKVVEILGDRNVQDIKLLKISGPMNSTDWEGVRRLKGLVGLDMIGVDVTEIPDNAFYQLSNLMTVRLPETIVEIGYQAFRGTMCSAIAIPASVERIQSEVWNGTPLTYITFAENSRLKRIGWAAFHDTRLKEFIMPDGVEEMEGETFSGCRWLKKIHISKSIKQIPGAMCYRTDLNSVEIPEGVTNIEGSAFAYNENLTSVVIPRNVSHLNSYAFEGCEKLKEVTIKASAVKMYRNVFSGCPVETIIVPTATPPTAPNDDPFPYVDKTTTTVLVPDFALATFKTDPYWFQYTRIQSTAEVSEGDYWAINGRLKLDPSTTFAGTPSVELNNGAVFEIAANTSVAFNDFTYNTQEDVPSCFLNESANVTANSLTAKFVVPESGRWYFFSPVTDVNMADVTYSSTDSWVIYSYSGSRRATENSSEGNWVKMTSDGTLKRGQGYIIQAGTPGALLLPAAASQHSAFFGLGEAPMSIADYSAESAENAGWNLVGNPYPAYYDIYSIALQAPITVWEERTYRAYSLTDDDYVLRPMQPFFVQKSSADITLAMPRGGRQGSKDVFHSNAPRASVVDPNRHKLNLEITRGKLEKADDYTRLVINEDASLAYEGRCDASKFMSMDSDVAQIYSLGERRHPLAINERPYADGNAALGVYLPEAGETYRISARRADRKAWLYDAVEMTEQDLTEGDYIFTATTSGQDDSRFSIRFAPSTNAVEGIEEADVNVTGNVGSISVMAPKGVAVAVYGVDGSLMGEAMAGEEVLEFTVAGGVYVVKANGQSFKTVVK